MAAAEETVVRDHAADLALRREMAHTIGRQRRLLDLAEEILVGALVEEPGL